MANFLSVSPNQIKFLPSVCLVLGLVFAAITVSFSAVSLGRLSTYILFIFKVSKWAVSSDTFFKSFSSAVNMFISIFIIQILQQPNFCVISQKLLAGKSKENSQIFILAALPSSGPHHIENTPQNRR